MGKYFKYAIGEILLVVIGILIALQINNWNESRKNRKSENQALINLKQEFEQNYKRLDLILTIKKRQEKEARQYLLLTTNDTIPLEEKIKAKLPGTYAGTWGITNTILNGLINTGSIDKIQNDSLKFLLTNWPVKVDRYTDREKMYTDVISQRRAYTSTFRPRKIILEGNYRNWPENYLSPQMQKESKASMIKIVQDVKHHNLIVDNLNTLYIQLIIATEITNDYLKIIQLIDEELEIRNIKSISR